MTIKVGDRLPEGSCRNSSKSKPRAARSGPNTFKVQESRQGQEDRIFGLPGAFTPTCSAKHVPELPAELRCAQGQGRRRDLVRLGQRSVRDGRLGPRPEDRRQGPHDGRRLGCLHEASSGSSST